MSSLLTARQLKTVQRIVERGMKTQVTILHRRTEHSPFSDDAQQEFEEGVTVKGWLREVPAGTIDVVSGVMANVGVYRLFLPIGTVVDNGDRVLIEGDEFVVQDMNDDSTYQATLRLSLRRAE